MISWVSVYVSNLYIPLFIYQAENLDMLKNLVNHALDEHAEFRRYKYFPLDPEYIDKDIMRKPAFRSIIYI